MRKFILAGLLFSGAAPAEAAKYISYDAFGRGTAYFWLPNGGYASRPVYVRVEAMIPLDGCDGYYLICSFSGTRRINFIYNQNPYGQLNLEFDYDLSGYPTSSHGYVTGFTNNYIASLPFLNVAIVEGDFGKGYVRSYPTGPVPEPASWSLMIGGFALAGLALRRHKMALNWA